MSKNKSQKLHSKKLINSSFSFKRFKCHYNECNKNYKTSNGLKQHMNAIHTRDKFFEIDFETCGKKFSQKPILNEDMNRHSGFKSFKCHYFDCNSSFIASSLFKSHMNSVLKKEKLFECNHKIVRKYFLKNLT